MVIKNWIHDVHLDNKWAEKLMDNNEEYKWERKDLVKRNEYYYCRHNFVHLKLNKHTCTNIWFY